MTDIVERLRKREFAATVVKDNPDIYRDAADEIERLRASTIPICVGRQVIGILANEGAWTSENGASIVAADVLFKNDPYDEIERLRRALHDIYEIYAGSMGNIEHAEGHYLVYLIREMADIAAEHKK